MDKFSNAAQIGNSIHKRKLPQKTYASQSKRRLNPEEPARKRQCISKETSGSLRMSTFTGPDSIKNRLSVPSSPVEDRFNAIFSDPLTEVTTSPASSPPPPALCSPGKDNDNNTSPSQKIPRTTRRNLSRALATINNNCRRRTVTRGKQRMTQLQIDLGGEIRTTCKGCGMDYIPSNTEDTTWHKRFHQMNLGGVDLGRPILRMLQPKKIWIGAESSARTGAPFIAIIDTKSSPSERNKAKEILGIVNTELSAAALDDKDLWGLTSIDCSTKDMASTGQSLHQPSTLQAPRFRTFLYINGSKCTGFCLAERITKAYKVEILSPTSTSKKPTIGSHISSSISITSAEEPALLGISRIWTSKQQRRSGIASALLQAARCNFLFRMEVPKASVAFSQPTESGGALAKAWFGESNQWLVYREA